MFVHHLAFRTPQLARLVAFYHDVVGLSFGRTQPGYSQWFVLGPTRLMLEQAEAHEPRVPQNTMELSLCVPVSEQAQRALEVRLRQAGVPIESRTAATLYFRDPDGRRVAASTHRFTDA